MHFMPFHLLTTVLDTQDGKVWGEIARRKTPTRRFAPNAWQRWRTRRQLLTLDDRQLRDIGLLPSQVYRETHRPFWR